MVVVLQNTSGPVAPRELARQIAEVVLGKPPDRSRRFPGDLAPFAGRFTGNGRGRPTTVSIAVKGPTLTFANLAAPADPPEPLRYYGNDTFGFRDTLVIFEKADGKVARLRLDTGSNHNILARQAENGGGLAGKAQPAGPPPAQLVPTFEVDPMWPKPLPNRWLIGAVAGVAVDAQDHVWIVHRPATLQPNETRSIWRAAPPVLEFDQAGNLVSSWGGPGEGYEWPDLEHGIYVDGDDVWLGGGGEKDAQHPEVHAAGQVPDADRPQRPQQGEQRYPEPRRGSEHDDRSSRRTSCTSPMAT